MNDSIDGILDDHQLCSYPAAQQPENVESTFRPTKRAGRIAGKAFQGEFRRNAWAQETRQANRISVQR